MKRCLCIIGLALALPLQAAESTAPESAAAVVHSLADAVSRAWSRQPAAQAQTHRDAQLSAESRLASGWTPGPPSISVSTTSDRLNARTGRQEWEIEAATPLWLRGQRGAQQSLVQARQSLLQAQTLAQRLEVAGQVRAAWWQLAAARAAVQVAQRRHATAEALLADVERRWRAGDLARTDANAARAELQAAQGDVVDALREERAAVAEWRALTGAVAPATLADEPAQGDGDGLDGHPQLVAAEAAIATARARLQLADRSRREAPELSMRLMRERDAAGEPYASAIGVQLSIPLGSAAKTHAEMSEVRAELVEAEVHALRLRERLQLERDGARQDVEAAAQRLTLAQRRSALAADTLQLLQKSFRLGESDLATLLRARADALDADAEVARLTTARARARSNLLQSLGTLP